LEATHPLEPVRSILEVHEDDEGEPRLLRNRFDALSETEKGVALDACETMSKELRADLPRTDGALLEFTLGLAVYFSFACSPLPATSPREGRWT
jgi:hypothetical protein